jgi:hypothetical protein
VRFELPAVDGSCLLELFEHERATVGAEVLRESARGLARVLVAHSIASRSPPSRSASVKAAWTSLSALATSLSALADE